MNLNTRAIGLAILLLLLFLAAALTLQWWLARETRQLRVLAVEEQRAKVGRIIAVSGVPPAQWDDYFQRELGVMVGGTVQLYRKDPPARTTTVSPERLSFTEPLVNAPGWEARVTFAAPALIRVQILHQRILAAVVLLALLLALIPLLVALITRRSQPGENGTRAPWAKSHATGLEQLARLTNERSAALAEEHAARARAEENLQVNQNLLDRSLAERVRLGRELHDNICQTLYAVCLTLESVQKKTPMAPEMKERTAQCLAELRRVNQQVRAYLAELEPSRVHSESFATALAGLLGSLPSGDEVRIERRLDPATIELIAPQHVPDIMNILREAISNGLRHGKARHIVLRAAQDDQNIALSVQDDGRGFVPQRGPGHGLGNMQARANALGGSLAIDSTPGQGTRVVLTLPLPTLA